jgi:hypothetical protein
MLINEHVRPPHAEADMDDIALAISKVHAGLQPGVSL